MSLIPRALCSLAPARLLDGVALPVKGSPPALAFHKHCHYYMNTHQSFSRVNVIKNAPSQHPSSMHLQCVHAGAAKRDKTSFPPG